jgi:predicted component of type VI protein secretion system
MPAQLVSHNEGPDILLDKPILLLGRDLECDIRLDSRKVSRRHCCIAQVGDHLVVRDLGSTNGVRINGVRVSEGDLKAGDEFVIGNFRYTLRWDDGAPPSQSRVEKQAPRHVATDRPPAEDDILEDCDEPVPLSDHADLRRGAPIARGIPVAPPPHSSPDRQTCQDNPPRFPATQILPDDIELAPKSDDFSRHPAPKPPHIDQDVSERIED